MQSGLAGCGEVVGNPAAVPPAHTQSFPNEPATPLPAGVDAMTGQQQRPIGAAHPGTKCVPAATFGASGVCQYSSM
jgi:hypothetical protein